MTLNVLAQNISTVSGSELLENKPEIIVIGWIFEATNFSASLKSSPAKTTTEVVPSPTSSSWTFEMSNLFIKHNINWLLYNIFTSLVYKFQSQESRDTKIIFIYWQSYCIILPSDLSFETNIKGKNNI